MESSFIAMLFRMKFINRWSLMFNTQTENLSVHTLECALLTHFLANISNVCFHKNYNADKLAVAAMYHDAPEILTGDLPTPIKYYNDDIRKAYKHIEDQAVISLTERLPAELQEVYHPYLSGSCLDAEEKKLIKAADRLCAYIKCIQELNAGNKEFSAAHKLVKQQIDDMECEELKYFVDNCIEAFSFSLDELKGTL